MMRDRKKRFIQGGSRPVIIDGKPCGHPHGHLAFAWRGRDTILRAVVVCNVCDSRHHVDERSDNMGWVRDVLRDFRKVETLLA